jgi:hypothetical protein
MGLASTLTVIFIVLKLVGVINWSWWWVLLPTLLDVGIGCLIFAGVVGSTAIRGRKQYKRKNRRNT